MFKAIATLISVLVIVALIGINLLGGVIAGIWLALLGEWRTIFVGFALSFGMPFVWAIAALPTLLVLAVTPTEEPIDGAPTASPTLWALIPLNLYMNALVCAWTLFVFWCFEQRINSNSPFPFVLWAYSTTMSPLAYMASKSGESNPAEGIAMLGASVVFVSVLVLYSLNIEMEIRIWVAGAIAVAMCLVGVTTALAAQREQERAVL